MQAVVKVAPALAAGCAVLLKPSPLASLSCVQLGDLATEAGLPRGALAVVTGGPPGGAADGAAALVRPARLDDLLHEHFARSPTLLLLTRIVGAPPEARLPLLHRQWPHGARAPPRLRRCAAPLGPRAGRQGRDARLQPLLCRLALLMPCLTLALASTLTLTLSQT